MVKKWSLFRGRPKHMVLETICPGMSPNYMVLKTMCLGTFQGLGLGPGPGAWGLGWGTCA